MSSSTSTLAYDIIARDRASSTFSKIGRAAGALGIGLGAIQLGQFVKDSVMVEAAFSSSMASIQVNAGIGEAALGRLSDYAIKMGQDTVYSANEAAEAMLELSKGGMSAAQIQGGALASTLNLAATEGIGLSDSATIVARTLKTFGLNAEDAASATDMLAGGSLASTANVSDLADALKYVGSTAKTSGYGLSDTVTALSALTDSGLASTTAGTALNRMLLGLTLGTTKAADTADDLGLSFTDAKGNLLPMVDVIEKLQGAFEGMGTAERNNSLKKIFGVEGMRAANILIENGAKGWEKYKTAVDKSGQAQKMADARMSGTKGAIERLDGAVETAQLKLGKALAPAVQTVADALSDNLGPAMDGAIELGGDLVDAVEPLVGVLKLVGAGLMTVGGFVDDLSPEMKTLGIEVGIAALLYPKLAGGIGAASSAMKNGVTYTRVLAAELGDVNTRGTVAAGALSKLAGVARQAGGVGGMLLLSQGTQETNRELGTLESVAGGALTGFAAGGPWGAAIGAGAGLLVGLATNTKRAGDAAADAQPDFEGLAASLDQVTGATTRATRAQIYDDLERSGALKTLNAYGVSSRTAVDAIMGHGAALHQVQAVQARATAEYEANTAAIERNKAEIEALITSGESATDAGQARVIALQGENAELGIRNKEISKGTGIINEEIKGLRESQKAITDKAKAVEAIRKLYGKLPKDVVTELKQHGAPETMADVKDLIRQYDLTPKQVETLLKQIGVDKSIADIKRLIATQNALHDRTITITTLYRGLSAPGGAGPTRGRPDDTTGGGAQPKTKTGGSSGRYRTSSRSDRPLTKGDLESLQLNVTGIDPGAKAYFYTGGSSRY